MRQLARLPCPVQGSSQRNGAAVQPQGIKACLLGLSGSLLPSTGGLVEVTIREKSVTKPASLEPVASQLTQDRRMEQPPGGVPTSVKMLSQGGLSLSKFEH